MLVCFLYHFSVTNYMPVYMPAICKRKLVYLSGRIWSDPVAQVSAAAFE
jgi:hypothetical protein